MSKGLEALHHPRIKSAKVDISVEGKHDIAYMFFDDTKQYAAIEKELEEAEETKKELAQVMKDYQDLGNSCYKKLKALEIIKRKQVSIRALEQCVKTNCSYPGLTQEEYDLLKEVLL